MKRVLIGLSVFLAFCSIASADPFQVRITATGYGTGGTAPWAPYTIEKQSNAPLWMETSFNTFCVEDDRYFYPNNIYWATIDDEVQHGGSPSLSDEVKRIYAAYLNGNLSSNSVSANEIQKSIWHERGYISYTHDTDVSDLFALAATNPIIDGWDRVKVLNLWGPNNGGPINYDQDIQSQLVMTPVPVPGTFLLGGIGLAVANWQLKRRKTA